MNAARRKQIAWWASKVKEQAREYCDVALRKDLEAANKLDEISVLAEQLHSQLAGQPMSNSRGGGR